MLLENEPLYRQNLLEFLALVSAQMDVCQRPGVDAPLNERLGHKGYFVIDGNAHPIFVIKSKAGPVSESPELFIAGSPQEHRRHINRIVHAKQSVLPSFQRI